MATFDSLANECVLHIFGFLDPYALGKVSRVCKRFNQLANDRQLWENIYGFKGEDARPRSIIRARFIASRYSIKSYSPAMEENLTLATSSKIVTHDVDNDVIKVENTLGEVLFRMQAQGYNGIRITNHAIALKIPSNIAVYNVAQNITHQFSCMNTVHDFYISKNNLWFVNVLSLVAYDLITKVQTFKKQLDAGDRYFSIKVSQNEKWALVENDSRKEWQLVNLSLENDCIVLRLPINEGEYQFVDNYLLSTPEVPADDSLLLNCTSLEKRTFNFGKGLTFIGCWQDTIIYFEGSMLTRYSVENLGVIDSLTMATKIRKAKICEDSILVFCENSLHIFDLRRNFEMVFTLDQTGIAEAFLVSPCLLLAKDNGSFQVLDFTFQPSKEKLIVRLAKSILNKWL